MAWVPILGSGADYDFQPAGTAVLGGDSVVRYSGEFGGISGWDIEFPGNARVRVTCIKYEAAGGASGADYEPAMMVLGGENVINEAPPYPATTMPDNSPVETFSPGQFSSPEDIDWLTYYATSLNLGGGWAGADTDYEFLIEVWVDDPDPPDPPGPTGSKPYVIRKTHRAYMGSDTTLAAWVRDELGRHDLTQYGDIRVEIKRDTRGRAELTVPASGTQDGKLEFTITADGARTRLRPGIFGLQVVADGSVIQIGYLEVV